MGARCPALAASPCPRCGLVGSELRCPRCDALKVSGCSGACGSCAAGGPGLLERLREAVGERRGA